jgi:hypothetical protein
VSGLSCDGFSNPLCRLQCERILTQAETRGCEDEFDQLEACIEELSSCGDSCSAEADALAGCLGPVTTPLDQFVR